MSEIQTRPPVAGNCFIFQFEDGADATVGIVRLLACKNSFSRSELAGHPQGFQIGHGAAAAEVVPATASKEINSRAATG